MRVVENKVLRTTSGPKGDEVTDEWRELHNEDTKQLYSTNIIRVINSTRIRWTQHEGRTVERCTKGFGGETCGKGTTWQIQAQMEG
jgi:hypothetical protein